MKSHEPVYINSLVNQYRYIEHACDSIERSPPALERSNDALQPILLRWSNANAGDAKRGTTSSFTQLINTFRVDLRSGVMAILIDIHKGQLSYRKSDATSSPPGMRRY